jgi:3'(2'), 5'-bisphosphate nucleotidase
MPSEFIDVARQLAEDAGRRVMELRQTTLVKERKADHSLVTNADHEADRIIRSGLQRHFPTHAILTEESGIEGDRQSEYLWVVDPLDGTKAYARGTAGFSVMIGLLRKGKPYAGVVKDPWEGYLYEALSREGAYSSFKGKREHLNVSKKRDWEEMPLVTSTDFPESLAKAIKARLPSPWIPAINSVGIKVGLLVRQLADLYVNHHAVHYWDTVAPQIILEEAGGVFSFSDGRPLSYNLAGDFRHGSPTVASNGQRHRDLIGVLKPLMTAPSSRKVVEDERA